MPPAKSAAGGTVAIVMQENVATGFSSSGLSKWRGVYVIKGVSYDRNTQMLSYALVYDLQRGRIEQKWCLSPFGGFKFKHDDTTFTLIGTSSKRRQNLFRNGTASLKDVKGLLFPPSWQR